MSTLIELSPSALRKAADIRENILALEQELQQLVGESALAETKKASSPTKAADATPTAKAAKQAAKSKKSVNEARLKALAKAREARWAKYRAAKKAVAGVPF